MSGLKKAFAVGLLAASIVALAGTSWAQEAGGGGRPGGGGGGGARMDPAQMRQGQLDRVKEQLGATDEEWAALSPKVEKVLTLQTEIQMTTRMGARGGRGGNAQATGMSDLSKAASDLRTALEDANTPAEQITAKVAAYREAREKSRQELAAAQEQLREVLSVRQEAQLVLRGILD